MCDICHSVLHWRYKNETSKNFETIPTKNLYPAAQNIMAQDLMPKYGWVSGDSIFGHKMSGDSIFEHNVFSN